MASHYGSLKEETSNYESDRPHIARGTSTEFFHYCDKITTSLFTINNGITNLEKTLRLIGTPSDNQVLRDRITQLNLDTGSTVQETTNLLQSLHSLTQNDKQRKIRVQRLQADFQSSATRFSELQKKVIKTIQSARLPPDMVAAELDSEASREKLEAEGEKTYAMKKESQVLEFEVAMREEREQQIRSLESNIVDLGDIMQKLSQMTAEQGSVVDTIESNVESTYDDVEGANEQLIKASSSQNKRRRKLCFCIMLAVIVIIIIGIILGMQLSK